MAYDKLKPDNKQLGRKAIRILQLNLRFCIFLSMIITIVFLIVYLNLTLNKTPKYLTLNQYVSNLFNDPYQTPTMRQTNSSEEEGEEFYADEFDYIWSDESIELFQKQLGIEDDNNSTKTKTVECHSNMQFIMSALPGPNDDILSDIVWQYFSLLALESQTIQYNSKGEKLYLKAFVTEKMRTKLNELFEGLPLQTFTILPSTCYNLKYAEIIGNNSPISLKEIALASTPLLLDPKAKRIKEIAQLFGSKMRPFFRFTSKIMDEVKEEFLVTKTIQEVEVEREMDINFVGVYITSDDKLPIEYYQKAMNFHRKGDRTIFIFICDIETFIFCEESFDGKHAVGDARILRTSVKTFDFALMTSCNSTIVSNDVGVLHALLNNGVTTVYKPKLTEEPDYYVPWMISEHMANWYAID